MTSDNLPALDALADRINTAVARLRRTSVCVGRMGAR